MRFWKSEVFCRHSAVRAVPVVPRADVFLMYLWGGNTSPHRIPLPSSAPK